MSSVVDASQRILLNRNAIMALWEERLLRNLPPAQYLSKPLLRNSLPEWLETLARAFSSSNPASQSRALEQKAEKHGKERSLMNFDLNQMLYEYTVLRQAIFDTLEKDQPLSPRERDIIFDAIQSSMRIAAVEFERSLSRSSRVRNALSLVRADSSSKKILISLVIMLIATGLQGAAWSIFKPLAYFLYYPAVLLASLLGDGLTSVALALLLAQYFFVPPLSPMSSGGAAVLARSIIFGITALGIALATRSFKKARRAAEVALSEQQHLRLVSEERQRALAQSGQDLGDAIRDLEEERALREQFVTTLAHDLRTPLTSAKMALDLALRYPEKTDTVLRLTQKAVNAINRSDKMIQDLLDANRIRAGQPFSLNLEACDFSRIISEVVDEMSILHANRLKIVAPARFEGFWSSSAVRRITENLVSNAIKYGEPRAEITITIRPQGERVELAVHNWGRPISPQEQEGLFKLFHRSKSANGSGKDGWGVGLTLVRGLAEALGGSVEVHSSENNGTTFLVNLPVDSRAHQSFGQFRKAS